MPNKLLQPTANSAAAELHRYVCGYREGSMSQELRLYHAMIWAQGLDRPGKRVTVQANSLQEAKALLEAEHGVGSVFNLHNKEDAESPR